MITKAHIINFVYTVGITTTIVKKNEKRYKKHKPLC